MRENAHHCRLLPPLLTVATTFSTTAEKNNPSPTPAGKRRDPRKIPIRASVTIVERPIVVEGGRKKKKKVKSKKEKKKKRDEGRARKRTISRDETRKFDRLSRFLPLLPLSPPSFDRQSPTTTAALSRALRGEKFQRFHHLRGGMEREAEEGGGEEPDHLDHQS